MDATRGFLLVIFFGFALTGCNQQPKVLNSANCTNQAVPKSYLVRWNGQVPPEFTKNKLAPGSTTTRFNMDEETLTRDVLKKHSGEYLFAEHEYFINDVNDKTIHTDDTATVWGPQDIHTSSAWSYLNEQGDNIIVAVVDSGVDSNHPLLAGQITPGYSYIGSSTDTSDGLDHGTHVSGVIAGLAGANNFTGIAPHAKIMPLKFIDSQGGGAVGDAISATAYAVSHGAKVINASWGGADCSASLQQEIVAATQSGVVFVNAAGNSSNNLSYAPEYPAVYQVTGKITVGAYNVTETLSLFSNYGSLVDLAAPGESILSTVPPTNGQSEGQMKAMSGTSMATPFVAGVAALLFAAKPNATPAQIAAAINASVIPGNYGVRTFGRLDAYQAAQYFMTH